MLGEGLYPPFRAVTEGAFGGRPCPSAIGEEESCFSAMGVEHVEGAGVGLDVVVVGAEAGEVIDMRGPAIGVVDAVVLLGVEGVDGAARPTAGAIAAIEVDALGFGR